MKDFLRNAVNGDLDITAGNFGLVEGREAIAQFVGVRLKAFVGEWPYNITYGGVDRSQMLVKAPDLSVVGAIRKAAMLDVPGVTRIRRYTPSFDRATRAYSEDAELDTTEGTVEI